MVIETIDLLHDVYEERAESFKTRLQNDIRV